MRDLNLAINSPVHPGAISAARLLVNHGKEIAPTLLTIKEQMRETSRAQYVGFNGTFMTATKPSSVCLPMAIYNCSSRYTNALDLQLPFH
jgi:hypothetical protein